MVFQLILEGQHACNTALVHELFDPEDVQAVLSIPLPIRSNEDKLIWVLYSKGAFTVKSAYYTVIQHTSTLHQSQTPWKKIWKMNAPKRIRMFLWRIGVNVLAEENMLEKIRSTRFQGCSLRGRG